MREHIGFSEETRNEIMRMRDGKNEKRRGLTSLAKRKNKRMSDMIDSWL